ncbi:MAG: ribosome biogenesis factor YjgA [Desulfovibrionaceae bacterium]|nr:ribosome biogenesis factor YjgA [Desulfovibrionaceae bacterium]
MAKKNVYQWNKEAQDGDEAYVSRSQKKRDSTALQKLGEELAKLPISHLGKLPLTPDLHEAFAELARVNSKEGRRRQLQYIGRLMREADSEAIRAALDAMLLGHTQDMRVFHQAERLRTALLETPATEWEALLAQLPLPAGEEGQRQRQSLHSLAQAARDEQSQKEKTTASRELFRALQPIFRQQK